MPTYGLYLSTLVHEFIGIYVRKLSKIILKNNFNDASNCDILYIKERAKIEKDFDIIFNEILYIREQLNKQLKRNLTHYYQDRYNIFLEV